MTICELVSADIDARARLGMERYGKPLLPGNVRAALQEAYEEALDQAIYLKQAILSLDDRDRAVQHCLECEKEFTGVRTDVCPHCRATRTIVDGPIEEAQEGTQDAPESSEGIQTAKPDEDASEGHLCHKCQRKFTSAGRLDQHERSGNCKGIVVKRPRGRPRRASVTGSLCCGYPVTIGAPHALGNRYCGKCEQPCQWRSFDGTLQPGPDKSFICKGMEDCPRLTEYKDGYCLPCWEKRRPKASKEEQEILDELHSGENDNE